MLNISESCSLRNEIKGRFFCVLYRTPGVFAVSPGINGNGTYRVQEWLLGLLSLVTTFSSILLLF